jgi:hypothetical protein
MLADILQSLRETFAALATADFLTQRLLARGRGKALHYGCAIPFLASMCPSHTQAMHQTEWAFSIPAPRRADEEADRHFNWEESLCISQRTRAALRLMLQAVEDLGTTSQPIWPLLNSSTYENFVQGLAVTILSYTFSHIFLHTLESISTNGFNLRSKYLAAVPR